MSSGSSNQQNASGSKRRRESEEPWDEERPRVRIKTEFIFEEDDSNGPPTPPLPPRGAEDVIVKQERQEPGVAGGVDPRASMTPPPPGREDDVRDRAGEEENGCGRGEAAADEPIASSSRQTEFTLPQGYNPFAGTHLGQRRSQANVKSEPRDKEDDVEMGREKGAQGQDAEKGRESRQDVEGEGDNQSNGAGPSISGFFTFTTSEQLQPGLPNAMTANIKHVHVARPQVAHYYSHAPEEELKYVDESGEKINTLPMFNGEKAQGSDIDSDASGDEKEEPLHQDGERLTRYYQRNTVYEKYDFESKKVDASRLAVYEKKTHILNTLEKNRVVIIEGFTGCGKTTQVPQFIMDKCREDKRFCNIVVTQPRKIAAISVARRVCFERNWQLGTVVGYQVGMEVKRDKVDTLLTFMTTGVLLQKLISQRSLKEFTHIIIDEVHERDLESDFLLLVIKRIMASDLAGKERHVKLILMSATIDTAKFERYFQFKSVDGDIRGPPVIKIPFIARHRIDEYYLDDLLRTKMDLLNIIDSNMDREKASIQEDIYDIAVSCIIALDDIEKDSNHDPRMRIKKGPQKKRGAVLVFLPGMEEIKTLQRALDSARKKRCQTREQGDFRWVIYPLHSSVTAEDQNKVFDHPGDYFRKIILSTNIAESSVTVPDIEYVIDFCLTKSLCVDQTTNFTTLRMVWASKSQCVQRRGRSGRVADGKVYRLVPKSFYLKLEQDIVPEMKRSNLETVILMCKKFDLDCPRNLLRDALDPPNLSNLERAVSTLKELGALTIIIKKGKDRAAYDTCDGDLTFVGKVMAALPIPQQCTRLILFGHCFGVMREAIIIAAGLSVKSPFQTGFQKQLFTYLEKMKHAKRSFSDLFALYHVYMHWICTFCENGSSGGSRSFHREIQWARGVMVHLSVLREIKSTVELLEERLKKLGIEDRDSYALPVDPNANRVELTSQQGIFLKLSIAGAFYPNYFLRRRPDLRQYEREMNKEVNGNDVFRTVYFKGFPAEHNGKLYAKHVSDYLATGLSIPSVKFDGQKVFAIFDTSIGETIGPFSTGMFRALKLRQLRNENLEFRVLWKENERKAMQAWEHHVNHRRGYPCPGLHDLPAVDEDVVKIKVQHILTPSQFWVVTGQCFDKLQRIYNLIQDNFTFLELPPQKLSPNCVCLAPFQGVYYRAKVLKLEGGSAGAEPKSLVYFIDYGNSLWVSTSLLSDFSQYMFDQGITRVPCLAIECRLEKMKPNIVHGLHWSQESIDTMKKFCAKAPFLELNIFSIYQSIMVGELIGYGDVEKKSQQCSLNQLLITQNDTGKIFAEIAPEPYLSMENRRARDRARLMDVREKRAAGDEQVGDPLDLDYVQPPSGEEAKQPVTLKGPWSPLEMNFQALVHCSTTKPVKIDNNSVNSVVLDHEPTTSNSRMLVASNIGVADKSKTVMIRDSTIMSAIPGILQLVCMIFAPRIELRADRNLTKYVGLLCGCGTVPINPNDPTADKNMAVHPDNDMEIVFDTEIDDEDIDQVNTIRYYLNNLLRDFRSANKAEHHKLLRDSIIKLLRRQRKKVDEEIWPQEEYVWDRIPEELINNSVAHGLAFNHDDIYVPHYKIKLNKQVVEELVWDGCY